MSATEHLIRCISISTLNRTNWPRLLLSEGASITSW